MATFFNEKFAGIRIGNWLFYIAIILMIYSLLLSKGIIQ